MYWGGLPFPPPVGRRSAIPSSQGQKEKRASEDEMAGQHHQCNERELGQTSRDGEGQGGLVLCSPSGHKESDTTEHLNNNMVRMVPQ